MINNQMNELREQLKISVIIPIYDIEKYLEECVNSVLNQDYERIEIILVNDGSTDESGDLCNQFAQKNSKVKVIHKENGGLSDARNVGIKAATGDYLMFLDGDDSWDDTGALTRLVARLNETKVDVLNFSYKKYYEDTGEKVPYFDNLLAMPVILKNKQEQYDYLTKHRLYIASACNKLIKRSLFSEKMLFQKGIYSEDIEWCLRLLLYAESMDFVCENFYCYRQRRDSITHTINDKKCQDLCNNIKKCFSVIEICDEDIKEYLKRYVAYQYGTFFKVQAQAENKQNEVIEELEKYTDILSYHCGNRKLRILNIGCKIFGFKQFCGLIRFLYNIRKKGE